MTERPRSFNSDPKSNTNHDGFCLNHPNKHMFHVPTSDFFTCSANWNFSVGVGVGVKAVCGVEGGNSTSDSVMLECGKTWKKHIRYIITDFLSGLSIFTSEKKGEKILQIKAYTMKY